MLIGVVRLPAEHGAGNLNEDAEIHYRILIGCLLSSAKQTGTLLTSLNASYYYCTHGLYILVSETVDKHFSICVWERLCPTGEVKTLLEAIIERWKAHVSWAAVSTYAR